MTSLPRFPYQDHAVPVNRRVEDLLSRMTLEDKAGQLFQPMAVLGDLDTPGFMGFPSVRELLSRRITHANILGPGKVREIAQWHNAIQEECLKTPLGIPFTISSDPRHTFTNNPGAMLAADEFSAWPEFLAFAALDDVELTRRYADIVRREYLAVGIRTALHPQIDISTDPRWGRTNGTFGEDADIVTRHGVAYIEGLQGDGVSPTTLSAIAKHFPGGGPQKDGEDPHFAYGAEQVYPGGQFDLHLTPFKAAIKAGVAQMMPYYGKPMGTQYEEVGFAFNKGILTDLLRGELGYEGIICSDWGILNMTFWGVEDLTIPERMAKALDAGVDQFGGEYSPDVLIDLVRAGTVSESRIDESVRRLLKQKFLLGQFDDARFVDVEKAIHLVGQADAQKEGFDAQCASLTLLKNDESEHSHAPLLPIPQHYRIYCEGIDPQSPSAPFTCVDSPTQADIALIRLQAPYEPRGEVGTLESFFHAGSLEFSPETITHLRDLAEVVPVVVDVYLDRPVILGPIADIASALIVNYGASDRALFTVISGQAAPLGRLPFDIPKSQSAADQQLPDVPFDTENPTFTHGFGLRYRD
ncbi:MAG: glycoside hydrolase family 3 N-terminal domain-containing protein [Actinomycetaceae bacterium]|nr:glycoside hydrolase family 3 N-terminal domain-containing protein [Actinomycetaceae bacterium]